MEEGEPSSVLLLKVEALILFIFICIFIYLIALEGTLQCQL